MKGFILDFLRRGSMSCGIGPVVLSVLYAILQRNGELGTLSVDSVCVGILSITALAFVAADEAFSAISEAFSGICDEYLLNFLKLLCENGRIKELLSCIEEFEYLKTLAENKTTATVFYAYPLDEAQKQALRAKLENKVGKNIDFIFIEDKSLIGGIKVELDGKAIDGSAKHYLNKVKGVISQ